jgi:hypothetical protein
VLCVPPQLAHLVLSTRSWAAQATQWASARKPLPLPYVFATLPRRALAIPPLTFASAAIAVHALFIFDRHLAIEKWAKYKEDFHLRFRWTPRRVADVLIWGIALPVGVYYLIRNEQVSHTNRSEE